MRLKPKGEDNMFIFNLGKDKRIGLQPSQVDELLTRIIIAMATSLKVDPEKICDVIEKGEDRVWSENFLKILNKRTGVLRKKINKLKR